jgi:hypothetical protein
VRVGTEINTGQEHTMSLTEEVQTQLRRASENDQADRNTEPPHTVSNQNGEEAEEGMQGGDEDRDQPADDRADD